MFNTTNTVGARDDVDIDVLLPRSCEFTHKTPANMKSHFFCGQPSQQQPPLELTMKQDQKHDSSGPRPTGSHGTFPLLKTPDPKAVAVSIKWFV